MQGASEREEHTQHRNVAKKNKGKGTGESKGQKPNKRGVSVMLKRNIKSLGKCPF
jgi:hypothetical protein